MLKLDEELKAMWPDHTLALENQDSATLKCTSLHADNVILTFIHSRASSKKCNNRDEVGRD